MAGALAGLLETKGSHALAHTNPRKSMLALYIAMQEEAEGIISALGAQLLDEQPVIGTYYRAELLRGESSLNSPSLLIATSGKDRATGSDCIGTEPAALIANDLICHHGVSEMLNAGTCGAHSTLGADIADSFIIAPTIFNHDHRIPLPKLQELGFGSHPTSQRATERAKQLELPTAILSSGNSLDHTERDLEIFLQHGAQLKDMEGSALAWVCRQHDIPLTCLKVVTDIFDLPHPAAEQFAQNLQAASRVVTQEGLRLLAL